MRVSRLILLLLQSVTLSSGFISSRTALVPCSPFQMLRHSMALQAEERSSKSNGSDHSNGAMKDIERPPLLNIPNVLTIARVVMVPFMQVLFYWESPWRNLACCGLFFLAALTDFLDGFLARRWNIISPFGTFLDPVADKLMVAAVLVQLSARVAASGWSLEGAIVSLSCGATLCREISVSALREWMAEQGSRATVKVGWLGKCKTALQMASLTFLLLVMPGGPQRSYVSGKVGVIVNQVALTGLWISTLLAMVSGVQYFAAAWPYLSGSKAKES